MMLDSTKTYEVPEGVHRRSELSEQEIRAFIKTQIPRWLGSRAQALLVEEMEVCSGRARIDLAVITDRLIGIEIKGPKDDVTRLPGQISAYSECFDYVVLATHDSLVTSAAPLVPDWWGIVAGSQKESRLRYRFLRHPQPNPTLNLDKLLALLWRSEIDALVRTLVGCTPEPRATKRLMRTALLSKVDAPLLRKATLEKLRERPDWRWIPI